MASSCCVAKDLVVTFKIGKSCYLGVMDDSRDGSMYDFAVDGHLGVRAEFSVLLAGAREDAEQYGGTIYIYHCVPVAKVTRRKTTLLKAAPDELWRMAGLAALEGNPI